MKLILTFLLLASASVAQTITGGVSFKGQITINGITTTPLSGSVNLSGTLTGGLIDPHITHPGLQGDTNLCIQTAATYASGASAGISTLNLNDGAGNRTISGTILCTSNDGRSSAGIGAIGLYKLPVLDMSSEPTTAPTPYIWLNSFGTDADPLGDAPAGWNADCTLHANNGVRICDWKSWQQTSVEGYLIMPVARQENSTSGVRYATGDSTLVVSPDGGAHWCNPYTWAQHSTGHGCDVTNWTATATTGDAPLPPTDGTYTASPSSIMWKDVSPYNGTMNFMGRQAFFNYSQNNATTGMPHGSDTYLYMFGHNGLSNRYILARVPKTINSIMDVTAYEYYICSGYSQTSVCDGEDNANWTSTLASATMLFAGNGGDLVGSGTSSNPLPNGFTNHFGILHGGPIYYCANGGCQYVIAAAQTYLFTGNPNDRYKTFRTNLINFSTPWGPFTGTDKPFHYTYLFGFFNPFAYTLSVPDSTPYHARFIAAGSSGQYSSEGTVFYQSFDITPSANQLGADINGCTPYEFATGSVAGKIIRTNLWGFFDFFSHGCEGDINDDFFSGKIFAGLNANDIATYPSTKQLVGCFTDGGVKCGNPNSGRSLIYTPNGIYLGNSGYSTRLELRDQVPGVYNAITSSPLTSSADPAFTMSFAVQPAAIATTDAVLAAIGPDSVHQFYAYASYAEAGKVGFTWFTTGGTTALKTAAAWLEDSVTVYISVTKATGAITICTSVPCSATVHVYINGVEVAMTVVSGAGGTPSMAAGKHNIGGDDVFSNSFSGTWGSLEIYSSVLSAAQILHNYGVQVAALNPKGFNLPGGAAFTPTTDTTYTQALIAYTAPSAGDCTVKVSELADFSVLVHDVDTSLFTNANLDSRASSANDGTARQFVVGSQVPALGSDAAIYSRALQANKQHYYEVTCGASVASGTFTTENIPVGDTYNAPPWANPAIPGGWLIPTIGTVRTQTIVDPVKGTLLSPVSIPTDHLGAGSGTAGITIYDGAGIRASNEATHVDGSSNTLYLCNLDDAVGKHALFSIYPATGITNFLGQIQLNPNQSPNDSANSSVDDNLHAYNYTDSTTTTKQFNYTGAYAPVTGVDGDGAGNPAAFDGGTTFLTSPLSTLMNAYDATFDNAIFSACAIFWTRSGSRYNLVVCPRSIQDSYGWLGIFDSDPGVKNIIAAWNTFTQPAAKYNGIHEYQIVYGSNLVEVNWHTLNIGNTTLGTAEVGTTSVGSASGGATSITVAGAITSLASGGDSACCPAAAVGDRFRIQSEGGTNFAITNIASNVWTFTPALNATVANGTRVYMLGNGVPSTADGNTALTYWDFLNDPDGSDTTGITVIHDPTISGGGHVTWGPLGRASEAYQITPRNGGSVLAALNTTPITFDPTTAYNGVSVPAYGGLLVEHPAYQLTNTDPWFGDSVAFSGGSLSSPSTPTGRWYSADTGAVSVSGNLYQYFSDLNYPLNRKLIATLAINAGRSLRDISSPTTGNQIGTTSGDNFKYCVAHKANECRTGSSVGNIYFNVPSLTYLYCHGGDNATQWNDVCITDIPAYADTHMQFYFSAVSGADVKAKSRNITGGLHAPRVIKGGPMLKALPDGSYALFTIGDALSIPASIDVWKVKMPPLPSPDAVNRTAYINTPITVSSGANNAIVKFWYGDNGYCTSRAEDCYAVAATVPTDPFKYPTDGSAGTLATVTGLSCASGCNVSVPAISGKMLYYAIIKRDASNNITSTGVTQVIAIP